MRVNDYKVMVELTIPAADLIGASQLADTILNAVYKAYKIEGHVMKVSG